MQPAAASIGRHVRNSRPSGEKGLWIEMTSRTGDKPRYNCVHHSADTAEKDIMKQKDGDQREE